jgi:hypothetical protein
MRMDLTERRMTSMSLSGTERPSSVGDRTSATEGGTDVPPSNHQRVLMTRTGLCGAGSQRPPTRLHLRVTAPEAAGTP